MLANSGNLKAYQHDGFWQCKDHLREKEKLNNMIENNKAPWMVW